MENFIFCVLQVSWCVVQKSMNESQQVLISTTHIVMSNTVLISDSPLFIQLVLKLCKQLRWKVFRQDRSSRSEMIFKTGALSNRCSGPYFLRIHSECGKIGTRKNSLFGHISHSENLPNCFTDSYFHKTVWQEFSLINFKFRKT